VDSADAAREVRIGSRLRTGQASDPDQVARELGRLAGVDNLTDLGARGPLQGAVGEGSLPAVLRPCLGTHGALDLLDDFPLVARTTIETFTTYQGVNTGVRSEEEPGRILHERYTTAHRNPRWNYPYYGSVGTRAPLMFFW
jgi:hypothetical protein